MDSDVGPGDVIIKGRRRKYQNPSVKHSEHPDNLLKTNINVQNNSPICKLNDTSSDKKFNSPYHNVKYETSVTNAMESESVAKSIDRILITDSHLDRIECACKTSQELPTDETSMNIVESNIEFFKLTVQEILDNFFTSMQDFEYFKKRFYDIVGKNQDDAIAEIEDFITDIIQRIICSETSLVHADKNTTLHNMHTRKAESEKLLLNLNTIVGNLKMHKTTRSDLIINRKKNNGQILYSDNTNLHKDIKVNNKSIVSEINIKSRVNSIEKSKFASVGDFARLDVEPTESEDKLERNMHGSERDIPVKIANARKNIHFSDDFSSEDGRNSNGKSIIFKLCHFICKRFRKS